MFLASGAEVCALRVLLVTHISTRFERNLSAMCRMALSTWLNFTSRNWASVSSSVSNSSVLGWQQPNNNDAIITACCQAMTIIIIIMQRAPAGALPFPQFRATVHGYMLCAGQTTDPSSVVWGRSLLYAATFVEDEREVVSSPSAGRRCQRWGPVCGPHLNLNGWCGLRISDA